MSERFFCPHAGCRRSFAELWRLKVHCRAPPDVRGSGRERGHGEELKHCPRCQASLQAGRHHVGCSKGPVAPRQAMKRMQVAAAQYSSDHNNSSDNSDPSSPRKKRPYHKRSPFDETQGRGQPQLPPVTMTPCLLPETAAAGASAAPAADLEPHQKLEAVAARLAASVGDASELVSAARMLQNDGGVPASVLRQLSLALRQIGSQQANALEEAASLLDSAAAARLLVDASSGSAAFPATAAALDPSPRPLAVAERRALNQVEGTPEDEAAAGAADAARALATVPPPSGGYTGFRVAPDLIAALRGQQQQQRQQHGREQQRRREPPRDPAPKPPAAAPAVAGAGSRGGGGGAGGGTAAPATTANGESSATRTSSGAAGGAPAEVDGSGATSRSGVLLGGTDPLRRSLDGSAAAAAAAAAATLAPPPPLVSAIGSKDDRNQLSGGSAIAAAFLSGRL